MAKQNENAGAKTNVTLNLDYICSQILNLIITFISYLFNIKVWLCSYVVNDH